MRLILRLVLLLLLLLLQCAVDIKARRGPMTTVPTAARVAQR
jgi:hypothetical protein